MEIDFHIAPMVLVVVGFVCSIAAVLLKQTNFMGIAWYLTALGLGLIYVL